MHLRSRSLAATAALLLPLAFLATTSGNGLAASSSAPDPGDLTATSLTPSGRVDGFKSASAALAKSSPGLLKRTDSTLVPVMIKLDHDALASYRGGIEGLAATSPAKTGKDLNLKSQAARDYTAYMKSTEQAVTSELAKVAPKADVSGSQRVVYGGLSALVPANKVKDIVKIDGVVAVQKDQLNKLQTDASAAFLNTQPVYNALGGRATAGKGVIYGNLDSGIWPEHPSYADNGTLSAPPAPARECNYGDNPLTPAVDVFVCQNKLIGGAHFTDTYDAAIGDDTYAGTARDSNGHGTHTSSTSAGGVVNSAPVFGVNRGPIAGMAPGAWVMEYKVCGPQGCFSSDSAAAVAQAILDGVEVINFSISGGTDPLTDPVELAFLDAYAAGVFVAASAGNAGPGAGTANHLSPWVTTVAASTQKREFANTLSLTAGNGDTFTADGSSITAGAGPLPVVLSSAPPYSNNICSAPAAPGTFTGMIVACQRGGGPGRVQKGFNVLQGGAAGMVLYNPTLADVETDNHWLPTTHLADGTDFVAFMNSHTGVTGSFTAGVKRNGRGDVMAAFSSRGPAGKFIKPDVTAPGVQILAGHTPTPEDVAGGPPGELFQAIAGTSMSSPHVAGAAILLNAAHPTWTPGQIKSALMTNSIVGVLKEDLVTPADPFDMGAGRINLERANLAPLTFDESAADYAALTGDPVHAVDLNLPSINAPVLPGQLTTTRNVKNVTGQQLTFNVVASAPAGSKITVFPKTFKLKSGASRNLTITIETDAPIGVQQFGQIKITATNPAFRQMHLPVAWIHTQGTVALSQSCIPPTIPKGDQTTCDVVATNNSFDSQAIEITSKVSNHLTIEDVTGAQQPDLRTAHLPLRTLAGAKLGVPSVDPGALFGYIPLSSFGVTPIPIGDEEIINFNSPAFSYNGKSYTRFGIDSNGYVLAGGGTSQDNNCCDLPAGANPAPPNNMLAPFWTDLDGTGAPGVFVATLTDGVNTWIVVEYQVNVFGTTSNRTFQTWIGVNGTQDITFAYNPANLPADPNGQPFLVGAENEAGQGDMVAVLPTGDQRVTSTDPAPGGTATYSMLINGVSVGTGTVTTTMTATGVPGKTIVRTPVAITP
ncbi:S8 family serine peptidase [Nocardioides speluncae]|uniref:S8 family serine peptidase n=1 Tax=Nocardioides speluncae TaxID=2670337 RepID=UPI000D69FFC5|nr:S8 family serine peptidase [Nocardioides speluncae]